MSNRTAGGGLAALGDETPVLTSAGLPPIHVVVGTDEILLGDTNALVTAVGRRQDHVLPRRRHVARPPRVAGMLRGADE